MSTTAIGKKSRASSLLALLALVATLLGIAVGSAPGASASYSLWSGGAGSYEVTLNHNNVRVMTGGLIAAHNTPIFYTSGVTVGQSTGSSNAQRVVATYTLQRLEVGRTFDWGSVTDLDPRWLDIESTSRSVTMPGYVAGFASPTVALGAHEFSAIPLEATMRFYRVIFKIDWFDNVTGKLLGTRDVLPSEVNNRCPSEPTTTSCAVLDRALWWGR